MLVPRRNTTGVNSPTLGPRRWISARIGATTTAGKSPVRKRHNTLCRRPMVSSAGETRSKGRVSHAGNTSTAGAGKNANKSWARRSASAPVGTATTMGRRIVRFASAATKIVRADSATATIGAREITAFTAGESASISDREAKAGVVAVFIPRCREVGSWLHLCLEQRSTRLRLRFEPE